MDLLTLTYAQTVPLPLHLSIVGIAAISAGVVGVAVGTALTKVCFVNGRHALYAES